MTDTKPTPADILIAIAKARGLGSIQDGSSLAYFLAGANVRGGVAKPSRLEPACVILRPLEKLDVT
jgi:hypothetical protein